MQRNAKKCWEMQRNVVQQTGIILAKIWALDGRKFYFLSKFSKKVKIGQKLVGTNNSLTRVYPSSSSYNY